MESMTGYVMRLAEAHVVPVGALLNHELARFRLWEKCRTAQAYCFLPYHANGSNESAAEWVHALEVETGRTGLSLLTFLPLGGSLCTRYLFRRVRAWCADCYEEWRASGRIVYEPLLWSVRLARVCSRHRRALVETCPCCKNSMRPVGSTSRPGYCCNCRSWLGVASQHDGIAGEETPGRILSDCDFWLTEAVEQLIALMPRLEPASLRGTFSDNLRSCIDRLFRGYSAELARFTGAPFLDYWLSASFAPKLDQFLLFTERLRIPVAAFLLKKGSDGSLDWRSVKPDTERYTETKRRYRPASETRRALEEALHDGSAPSLAEVARRLHYRGTAGLRRISRRLCKRITQNYQNAFTPAPYHKGPRPQLCEPAKIRRALVRALAQKDPESVPSIATRLG